MLEFLDHESGPESLESLHGGLQKIIRKLIGTEDLNEPLLHNVWFCSLFGIWIHPQRKWRDLIYNTLVLIPQLANFAFLITNLYLNITSLAAVIENLSYSVISLTGIYTGFTFSLNVNRYDRLIKDLKLLNNKVNMNRQARAVERKVRLLTNCFSLYVLSGCTCYVLGPAINKKSCSETGATVCGLPTAGTFPYDVHRFPMFQLTFILHAYCAANSVFVIISSINFLAGTIAHICSHLNQIKTKLKAICESNNQDGDDERCEKLREVIIHHSQILDFAGEVSESFSSMMLVQSTAVPLLISVLTFLILLLKQVLDQVVDATYTLLYTVKVIIVAISSQGKATAFLDPNILRIVFNLGGWITELLIVSILGQQLIDESDEVADVAYNILWYNENVFFQKHVLFMILRSRQAISLTVASMGKVSLLLFSRVISSSYSYFTILYDLIIKSED